MSRGGLAHGIRPRDQQLHDRTHHRQVRCRARALASGPVPRPRRRQQDRARQGPGQPCVHRADPHRRRQGQGRRPLHDLVHRRSRKTGHATGPAEPPFRPGHLGNGKDHPLGPSRPLVPRTEPTWLQSQRPTQCPRRVRRCTDGRAAASRRAAARPRPVRLAIASPPSDGTRAG